MSCDLLSLQISKQPWTGPFQMSTLAPESNCPGLSCIPVSARKAHYEVLDSFLSYNLHPSRFIWSATSSVTPSLTLSMSPGCYMSITPPFTVQTAIPVTTFRIDAILCHVMEWDVDTITSRGYKILHEDVYLIYFCCIPLAHSSSSPEHLAQFLIVNICGSNMHFSQWKQLFHSAQLLELAIPSSCECQLSKSAASSFLPATDLLPYLNLNPQILRISLLELSFAGRETFTLITLGIIILACSRFLPSYSPVCLRSYTCFL